jgi:hypothetical protein
MHSKLDLQSLEPNTFYSLVSHDLSNLDSIGVIIASVA